jgi:hypothetical protein
LEVSNAVFILRQTFEIPGSLISVRFVFTRPAIERQIERCTRLFRAKLPEVKEHLQKLKAPAGDAKRAKS